MSLPSHPDLLAEKLQTRSILTLHLVSFQGVRSDDVIFWLSNVGFGSLLASNAVKHGCGRSMSSPLVVTLEEKTFLGKQASSSIGLETITHNLPDQHLVDAPGLSEQLSR